MSSFKVNDEVIYDSLSGLPIRGTILEVEDNTTIVVNFPGVAGSPYRLDTKNMKLVSNAIEDGSINYA